MLPPGFCSLSFWSLSVSVEMPPRPTARRLSLTPLRPPPSPVHILSAPFDTLLEDRDLIMFREIELAKARLAGSWVVLARTKDNHILASEQFIGYKTKQFSESGMPLVKVFATSEEDGTLIAQLVPLSSCFPGTIPVPEPGKLPTGADLLAFLTSEAFSIPGFLPACEIEILMKSKQAFTVSCGVPAVRGTMHCVPTALASPLKQPILPSDVSQDSSVPKSPQQHSVIHILDSTQKTASIAHPGTYGDHHLGWFREGAQHASQVLELTHPKVRKSNCCSRGIVYRPHCHLWEWAVPP
jgi:hypothetical protein